MNKRIRKKHLKRTMNGLLAAYDEYEAARERVFRKALQDVADAYGGSKETFYAAFLRYMEIVSIMASSGLPPKFLTERNTSASASFPLPPHRLPVQGPRAG